MKILDNDCAASPYQSIDSIAKICRRGCSLLLVCAFRYFQKPSKLSSSNPSNSERTILNKLYSTNFESLTESIFQITLRKNINEVLSSYDYYIQFGSIPLPYKTFFSTIHIITNLKLA